MSILDTPSLPSRLKHAADDTMLGYEDIAEIFHVNPKSVTYWIGRGLILGPSNFEAYQYGSIKDFKRNLWKLQDVKEFITELEKE